MLPRVLGEPLSLPIPVKSLSAAAPPPHLLLFLLSFTNLPFFPPLSPAHHLNYPRRSTPTNVDSDEAVSAFTNRSFHTEVSAHPRTAAWSQSIVRPPPAGCFQPAKERIGRTEESLDIVPRLIANYCNTHRADQQYGDIPRARPHADGCDYIVRSMPHRSAASSPATIVGEGTPIH